MRTFEANNITTYTTSSPLVSCSTASADSITYKLNGLLPKGLSFLVSSGKIVGTLKEETSGVAQGLSIQAIRSTGESNTLYFSIAYTVYPLINITSPAAGASFTINVDDETTEQTPLLTVLGTQIDGTTNNSVDCTNDLTRIKYTAVGLPPGFTLGLCSGKIYGKYTGGNILTTTYFYAVLTAANPTGSSTVNIAINIAPSQAPIITGVQDNSVRSIIKQKSYTLNDPLLTLTGTNSPTSATAQNLPPGFSLNGFKVVGTAPPSVAGSYETVFTVSNSAAASSPVKVIFKIPISIVTPTQGTEYNLTVGTANQNEIFSIVPSTVQPTETVTISTSTLPAGVTFQENKLIGVPEEVGVYPVTITAQSINYGEAVVTVLLSAAFARFVVSGKVKTAQDVGIEAVTVFYGGTTTTTDSSGNFSLSLPNGTYLLGVEKLKYTFSPSAPNTGTVVVQGAPVQNIDFVGNGPLRSLSGTVTNTATSQPLSNASITDGRGRTVTSNALGRFTINTETNQATTVTPTNPAFSFSPVTRTVPLGETDVVDLNFSATPIVQIAAPLGLAVTVGNARFVVTFTQPISSSAASIDYYEYSLDGGNSWAVSPNPSPASPSMEISTLTDRVTPLTNGVSYSLRIRGRSNAGDTGIGSTAVTVITGSTPGAPTISTITPGNSSLSISFNAPDNGGYTITNYAYSLDGSSAYTVRSPASTASPLTVTGLTNGKSYFVKIAAINSKGTGTASSVILAKPVGAPAAPVINLPVIPGDNKVLLNFSVVSNGGAPLTELQYTLNAKAATPTYHPVIGGQTTSPVTISGLVNGTSYDIGLKASNQAATSALSNIAEGVVPSAPTPPPSIPGAPVITALAGNKTITVSIATPANSNGSAITKYQYSLTGASWFDRTDSGTTGSPITITKATASNFLLNGTTYNVRIRAVNGLGPGAVSNVVSVTPISLPTAPTSVTANVVNSQINVQFAPAISSGSTIAAYQYSLDGGTTYYPSGTASNRFTITQITAGPPSIPLVKGTQYSLVLRAVTTSGLFGEPSSPVSVIISSPPSAPTIILPLMPSNSSVRFDYIAPVSDGGMPIAKYQYGLSVTGEWTDAVTLPPLTGGTGSIQISGLANGNSYLLKLRAVNQAGQAGPSTAPISFIPSNVPSPPGLTSLTQVTTSSISAVFTPPADNGGSAILGYKYSIDDGVTYSTIQEIVGTVNITGLTPQTTYIVKIKAVNAAGDSAASQAKTITLIALPDPYTAPTIISPIVSKNTALEITFTPPSNAAAGENVSYEYSLNGGLQWTTATGITSGTQANTFKLTLNNLINGQQYLVRLRGVNAAGPGLASNTVQGTPTGVPAAPTQITITPGDSIILVLLTPPANGGSPILNYKYSLNNGPFISSGSAQASFTINGVVNGVLYYVRVLASNINGDGPSSATPQTPVMPGIAPFAPLALSVTATSSAEAQLKFTPADPGSSPIIGYEYSLDNGATWVSAQTTQSPITVPSSSLTAGNTYDFKLRAISNVGSGASASVKRQWGTPEAPTNLTCSPISSTGVSLSFTPPATTWQPPVTSYQYSLNGGNIWTSAASTVLPISIKTLAAKATYNIAVRGVNSIGPGLSSSLVSFQAGLPGAPTVDFIRYNDITREFIAYFTPPASDGGSPITGYEYTLNGGTAYTPSPTAFSPITLKLATGSATAGRSYVFGLRTITKEGKSPISARYTGSKKTPSRPMDTSIVGATDRIEFYFNPPVITGDSEISHYEYKIAQTNENYAVAPWVPVYTTKSPILVQAVPGIYVADLRAVNLNGFTGKGAYENLYDYSAGVSVSVSETPSAPSKPIISSVTPGSNYLIVYFEVPYIGADSLTKIYYSLNEGATYSLAANTLSPLHIRQGLTYNTTYGLKIIANNNSFGASTVSPASDTFFTKTLSDGSSAPIINDYSVTIQQDVPIVQVNFTPPIENNTIIENYEYSLDNGNTWVQLIPSNPAATSITTEAWAYTLFKIRSVNALGYGEESSAKFIVTPDTLRPPKPRLTVTNYSITGPGFGNTSKYNWYTITFLNIVDKKITSVPITSYEMKAWLIGTTEPISSDPNNWSELESRVIYWEQDGYAWYTGYYTEYMGIDNVAGAPTYSDDGLNFLPLYQSFFFGDAWSWPGYSFRIRAVNALGVRSDPSDIYNAPYSNPT